MPLPRPRPRVSDASFSAHMIGSYRPVGSSSRHTFAPTQAIAGALEVRAPEAFDAARRRSADDPETTLVYETTLPDSYVASGSSAADPGRGFYLLALLDGERSAILTLTFAVGDDGFASQEVRDDVLTIACSAHLGATALPCSTAVAVR